MNAKAEVVVRDEAPIVPANDAVTLMQVIERAVANPNVDIDKMERLMAMYERQVARKAEADFNDAMTACQQQMHMIGADASNPQTRSRYATYGKLDSVLRPIYTKAGFSISYDTGKSEKEDHMRIVAYVSRGGYTRTYGVDMPADGKGAKGGDVMTKTHAAGAAMSYGMRYLLKMIFNVAVGEDDRDGNEPSGMQEEALNEWVKKIEAATTKPAAKEIWQAAHKEAEKAKDIEAAKRLKQALMDHAAFIDGAQK